MEVSPPRRHVQRNDTGARDGASPGRSKPACHADQLVRLSCRSWSWRPGKCPERSPMRGSSHGSILPFADAERRISRGSRVQPQSLSVTAMLARRVRYRRLGAGGETVAWPPGGRIYPPVLRAFRPGGRRLTGPLSFPATARWRAAAAWDSSWTCHGGKPWLARVSGHGRHGCRYLAGTDREIQWSARMCLVRPLRRLVCRMTQGRAGHAALFRGGS
jgi:hypothetical protein